MAEYHFDDLAKKAGIGNSAPSSALSPEEAEQEMGRMKFRFSVTDGYLTEKGGQFDYVLISPDAPLKEATGEAGCR